MPLNLLVVDDSKLVHAMISQTLEMVDADINELYHAMNGKEGLEILRSKPVDLVFSDIHMPVMDGVEMIETMSKDESLSKIPVVVISSEGSHKRIDELKQYGVQHYVRKPFTPEMVNDAMHAVRGEE